MPTRSWLRMITASVVAFAVSVPVTQSAKPTFADVARDASWSLPSVVELTHRGIFTGYEDGSFAPNRAVTRIEALAAIVRHMGLRAEAESDKTRRARLSAADTDLIKRDYDWATGYVEIAEKYNLLDDEKAAFGPGEQANRLWTTKLLVRALGLQREAERTMAAVLPFQDRTAVAEGDIGYVAVAVQRELLTGYEDGTFRPSRRVSRAELAALLDRAGNLYPDPTGEFGQLQGTAMSASGGNITVKQLRAEQTFPVDPAATVVRGGKLASIGDIIPGDEVSVLLKAGKAIHLAVTASATVTDGTKSGTVSSFGNDYITLYEQEGVTRSYKVGSAVAVSLKGSPAVWTDLRIGDEVAVTVAAGTVTSVDVLRSTALDGRYQGKVKSIEADRLTLTVNGSDMTFDANKEGVTVLFNNIPGDWTNIQIGSDAAIIVSGGVVYHVSVTQNTPVTQDGEGHVTAVYPKLQQIVVFRNGVNELYTISRSADIFRSGVESSLDKIMPGDKVGLVVENGVVTFIAVSEPAKEQVRNGIVKGIYMSHTYTGRSIAQVTIRMDQDGIPIHYTYEALPDATVVGGVEKLYSDRTEVELLLSDGKVSHIFVR
ncbi:S-layer homology domain-containing protein [Paenibacillus sp.]|uniref:S-layer homology domain-containing protein n=1 Tax=Paenibacillus sp. TaxID=58172 RepID=UPI002D4C3559|nr:S-layer homology domain-containing protein [Paenibacillus sp.]HZG86154.1 S-layer homology domain-containing protein [Paenibacillus sp.]